MQMFALVSMWHELTFLQAAVGEEDLPNGTLILTRQTSQTQNKPKSGLFPHLFLLERVKVSFCSGTDVSQPSLMDLVVEKHRVCAAKADDSKHGKQGLFSPSCSRRGNQGSFHRNTLSYKKVICFTSSVVFSLEGSFLSLRGTFVHKFACLFS